LAEWLRREHEVYAALAGSFIPALEGWDDDGVRPLLAIEDLSDADWTPRWDAVRVAAVLEALEELAAATPPPNTPTVRESFAELFDRWRVVEADPGPFLSVGLRDAAWLDRALPVILAAVDSAPISGDRVCHLDVRSDNLCFRDGRAVLIDWNWTSLANPAVDVAAWLPSVHVEGGPPPWEVMADGGALGAFVAGVWAAVAGLPPPETAPTVRDLQRQQLAVALDWIDRDLL
jgi:aminoglycoside phosphotransferase (APT) family kinase protein